MTQFFQEHTVFEPSGGGLYVAVLVTSPGSASNQCLLKSAQAHKRSLDLIIGLKK